ncbi:MULTISPECIES: hypothetical protein [Amycolatopsis]|uniref:Uncharacterized protein n=1 Tax=Amycolatopsis thermalba TaxID=944492 RepID=A0ABY4NMN4_9PSEU|nr:MULTISPECIES: hypothetical protein [Amycolatopsis]UQS21768.1 hypothetical protein L1857_02470 [Amycolatopsis thermalba]
MKLKKNPKANTGAVQLTALNRTGTCAGCGKRVDKTSNCCGKPACSRRIAAQL